MWRAWPVAIDVAVRFGDGDWPDCQSHLLYRERIVPVATPDYISRTKTITCPVDLVDHTLLHALSLDRSWYDWYQWFEHFGVQPGGPLAGPTFDNHLLMMQAALSGRGVALGWIGTASDCLRQGQLTAVLKDPIILDTGLYAVVRNTRDKRIESFLKWITALAAAETEIVNGSFL
ncbi:MAG: hypothetical protein EOR22_25190 [Mesorhizobium sp.]|nr:MAG: hypothetical protein EOR22_25190 [Mesorhizobium sp.]